MTQNTTGDEPEHEHDQQMELVDDRDVILQAIIVEAMSHDDAEDEPVFAIEVTLTTPAGVITGELVSPKVWLAATKATGPMMEQLLGLWDDIFDANSAKMKDGDELRDDDLQAIRFVHLREAHIIGANGAFVPGNTGIPWRGRLSQITGWWPGKLSVAPSGS